MIPNVHQSTGFPWPWFCKIYGAKYYGVPHKVNVLFSIIFANPKSVSFIYPSGEISTFYGFKSR
jgi:hypothetical protein